MTDIQQIAEHIARLSCVWERTSYRKPLLGGAWAPGRYYVGSFHSFEYGMPVALAYVFDSDAGTPISMGRSQADALRQARILIQKPNYAELVRVLAAAVSRDQIRREQESQAHQRAMLERMAADRAREKDSKPKIGRRRKAIFEKSGGICHYCKCQLEIDGVWHVEHKFPRALGGGNEQSNLVAACRPCNLAKSDRTEEEFFAIREAQ